MDRLYALSTFVLATALFGLTGVCQAQVVSSVFRRGDSNADGEVNLSDAVAALQHLFLGAGALPCDDAADADDSGTLNLTDAVYILNYLFLGRRSPPSPGPFDCSLDPTTDDLDCSTYNQQARLHACNTISTAAYPLLSERCSAHRQSFCVYFNQDEGFNHGFPSGLFGATEKINVTAGCIDDGVAASGCSTDPRDLDRNRGTVLRIVFAPLAPGEFAGLNIEEPEHWGVRRAGQGYDQRGATELVFDVRTPAPQGIEVEFGVGGPGHTTGFLPITSVWSTKRIALAALNLTQADLADVHLLFTIVTNDVHARNGAVLLLDNIRFEPVPASQQRSLGFPLGNETFGALPQGGPPFPLDQVLRNLTTTYESSLVQLAFAASPMPVDLSSERGLADAFVYALEHDNRGNPIPRAPDGSGCLHTGYSSGDLALHNSQQPGQGGAGEVRLAGFNCGISPTGFCLVLDGATGGNNAFAILALTSAYRRFSETRYLDAAQQIGRCIAGNLTDNTGAGFGGYYLGYQDEGVPPPKPLLTGKSIENNADIFSAFMEVARIEQQHGNNADAEEWTRRAQVAGDFVMEMFDPALGRFYAGTVPSGTLPSPGITPDGPQRGNDVINTFDFLDANTFTTLALAAAPRYRERIDWRRPVQYSLDAFAQSITAGGQEFHGFNIVKEPTAGANGIAWEFTAQVVVALRFVDRLYQQSQFEDEAHRYLEEIRRAQDSAPCGDGLGLVAATLQGGDRLPPLEQCLNTPFQCIPQRVGLAATTWAILADLNVNPLAP